MKIKTSNIIIMSGLFITAILVIAVTAPDFLHPPTPYIPTATLTK